MMKKYPIGQKLYKNGLPFSSPLEKNIVSLHERIELKKASLLIIDGAIGEGKTTKGVHAADYYNGIVMRLGYAPINLNFQLSMGGVDFQEKLKYCVENNLKVIIYDEAGDFNKRGSLTGFNQQLNRIFEMYRTYKILVILILPNFGVLDNSLFEKQIPRMLLHLEKRNNNYGNFKAYSLYRMYYIRKKMTKFTVPPHAYTQTQPNFCGHFYDLDPKRSQELEAISTEGKLRTLTENIIRNKGLLNVKQIAAIVSKAPQHVNKKIRDMGLEPEIKYRGANYFAVEDQEKLFRVWEKKKGFTKK